MNEQTLKHYWGIFIIVLIVTGAIGIGVLIDNLSSTTPMAQTPPATEEGIEEPDTLPRFTLADVAEHASAESCYMAVYGNVYDVTPYVSDSSHPGGQGSLISGCGKEMTATFDRIHSSGAKADLEEFKIGVLADE